MKKVFILAAIFALVFTACEQPTNDDNTPSTPKLPSLTIRNQSSYVLTNVKFSGIAFAVSGSNDLPISSQPVVKQLTANDVNKSGYITFTRKDIGIDCRTDSITITDQDYTFTFQDNTVVEEVANTSNRNILSQISFQSTVAIDYGSLPVAKGQLLNLGEVVVNYTKPGDFSLKNTGVGKLLLHEGGTEPVKITGEGAAAFSVIQPASPEIASDSSLPFTINFHPATAQTYTATVTVISNDKNSPFTFTITGAGVAPKSIAVVLYMEEEVLQNGTIDAGEMLTTQSKNIIVEIKNIGTEVLTIDTANITITGADAEAFTKTTNPAGNVPTNEKTQFTIKYEPVNAGENNAILTIPTNDSSRNPIVVFLRSTVLAAYLVRYDKNDSDAAGIMADSVYIFDREYPLSANLYTRGGYEFVAWNTNADGQGAEYLDSQNITNLASVIGSTVTLYAQWRIPIPKNVRVTSVTDNSVSLGWDALSGVNGYNIYRSNSENGAYDRINTVAVSGTAFTDTAAASYTSYWYKTGAITGGIEGTLSSPVLGTTLFSAPANVQITTVTNDSVSIVWDALDGANGYNLYRSNNKSGTYTKVNASTLTYTAFSDTGINPYTAVYYYRVSAVAGGAEGMQSNPVSPSVTVTGSSLAEKLAWLQSNAQSNSLYLIEVVTDESIAPQTISYSGKSNIGIFLIGNETMRTVYLSASGSLFTVGSGVTLILDNNITLRGRTNNNISLVYIDNGGILLMNTGAKITDNINSFSSSPFSSSYGGGVLVNNGGTFTMSGGEISGNSSYGGGVLVYGGTFTMNDGKISGNSASSAGGGVYMRGGTFTMNGGEISGNSAGIAGGGVIVNSGIFTMNNGEISGNSGGGVTVQEGGTFTMNSGKISGNSHSANGGGVMVFGTFTMKGGEISGNSSSGRGGGVCVSGYESSGTFTFGGGVIYGNNAAAGLRNTAPNGYGAAFYKSTATATAEYGRFVSTTFLKSGDLSTTNNTIRVVNGNLQTE